MDPVVHFEMPYEDKKRMADFYAKAFGWKAQMLGAEMGEYVVVETAETDDKRMIKEPGRINGGFYKKSDKNTGTGIVISVDDIKAAMKRVEDSGGKIIGASKGMEPDEIPGIGLYITVMDTEGNKVSLLQPSPKM